MIRPPFLQPGDTVGLVATARFTNKNHVMYAIETLKKWELNYKIGPHLYKKHNQFAGTDKERTEDFQLMLDDDNVKAIWSVKGGYGTIRLLDSLDFTNFQKNPKWIIGYSDVTALHSHVHANFHVPTIHATMGVSIPKNTPEAISSLEDALFGNPYSIVTKTAKLSKIGTATGELVGGNLSLISSMLGSNSSIDTGGKILFIEDLEEYLYHIDRMMMNVKRNGYLENLAGLIVGGMTHMKDNSTPFGKNSEEIILDLVKEYDYPVAVHFPAGHVKDNRALILGQEAKLMVGDPTTLLRLNETV